MIRYSSGGVDGPYDSHWICGMTTSTRYTLSTSRKNVPVRNIGKASNGMKKHRVGLENFLSRVCVSRNEFHRKQIKKSSRRWNFMLCSQLAFINTASNMLVRHRNDNKYDEELFWVTMRKSRLVSASRPLKYLGNIRAANLHVKELCTVAKTNVPPPL